MNAIVKVISSVAERSSFLVLCMTIILILLACKLVHLALRHLGQPRIISEFIVGFIVGNIPSFSLVLHDPLQNGFRLMEGFSSALYMFVLGLEMDLVAILRPPCPEAKIAAAGVVSTCIVYAVCMYAITHFHNGLGIYKNLGVERMRHIASFLFMFSATSSPIVTRLITELKLGQTQIGRHAIGAGLANDLLCTLTMCFLIALRETANGVAEIVTGVVVEMAVVAFVMRRLFRWVNRRNPEGKPFKGLDMAIIVFATQFLCHSAKFFRYDTKVNSFLIGLALPRQGRVSNFLISKINYILTSFILPLYLSMAGIEAHFTAAEGGQMASRWVRIAIITVLATLGKVLGTLVVCLSHGLHWLEAVTLGLILSIKGYYQIFFAVHAKNRNLIRGSEFVVLVLVVILSIVYVPFTVSLIVRRIRKIKDGNARLMGLQWYNPKSTLRITVGLHGVQNVAAAVKLAELMAKGSEAGVTLLATDMIQLTEQNKAALIYRQGLMVADDAVIELREQIGKSLDEHVDSIGRREGRGIITLQRNLAVSSFSDMHDDICSTSQDNMVVLIVLPHHKSQKPDGGMDLGHPGFRTVNRNVLHRAPCSVGILVDRGLGRDDNNLLSTPQHASSSQVHAVVIFIGGADDREALAYAAIVTQNSMVRLLTLRIIADADAAVDAPGRRGASMMPSWDTETKVDDDYFAGFYEHYIMRGRVEYMERYAKNGSDIVRMLRELDGRCRLFIVGQGSQRHSVLTEGLSEWAECPELGPIGDTLASSDFSPNASVLVIQQHNPARDSQYISNEFMSL